MDSRPSKQAVQQARDALGNGFLDLLRNDLGQPHAAQMINVLLAATEPLTDDDLAGACAQASIDLGHVEPKAYARVKAVHADTLHENKTTTYAVFVRNVVRTIL